MYIAPSSDCSLLTLKLPLKVPISKHIGLRLFSEWSQWRIQDLWKGGGGRESKFLDAAPENRPKSAKKQKSAEKGGGGGGAAADSAPPPWIRHWEWECYCSFQKIYGNLFKSTNTIIMASISCSNWNWGHNNLIQYICICSMCVHKINLYVLFFLFL